jgi:argininosuccinate lyase
MTDKQKKAPGAAKTGESKSDFAGVLPRNSTGNRMWGGRFAAGPGAIMQQINVSVGFDQRLALHDIAGSLAHAAMLGKTGILKSEDVRQISEGLDKIRARIEAGKFTFKAELEDVHMNIESALAAEIGEAGKRLHTARSRNDQVATGLRLYLRDACDALDDGLKELQAVLIAQAEKHTGTLMPGLTHFQPAQPISFAHHLMAYVEMLGRDRDRVSCARKRANESPLGAAALAGTSFAIDRNMTASELGFDWPMANSLDAVADRDFVLDYLYAAAVILMHLSRLAEEIILWMNPQFGFIGLSDGLTTGSSIMPQKRNPDAAELVRAKAGRVFGALVQMLTLLKALPLAYAKDLQEDKEQTFMTVDTLALALGAMTAMVADFKVNGEAMRRAAEEGFGTATDLADALVRELNLPFRDAHRITGEIVRLAEGKKLKLAEVKLADAQKIEPRITQAMLSALSVEASVKSRNSLGGTAPEVVRKAIGEAKKRFL